MKAWARALSAAFFNRSPIRQALSDNAWNARGHAVEVLHCARVVAVIEFDHVAVQMRFRNMVIRSDDPALHDAKEALGRVDVDVGTETGVLASRVVDGMMRSEALADPAIDG